MEKKIKNKIIFVKLNNNVKQQKKNKKKKLLSSPSMRKQYFVAINLLGE